VISGQMIHTDKYNGILFLCISVW